MKKLFSVILGTVLAASFAVTASAEVPAAAYPASGTTAPEGSVIIAGSLIGNETGWGGNANAGRAAAFDGDTATFFDPLGTADGYCGVDAGKPYVITKIVIHPRADNLGRYYGATIQGTNTPDDEESWTDIWMSLDEATEFTWQEINSDEFDVTDQAFQYFRYFNMLSHGDVAEVELYGYPEDGVVEAFPAPDATAEETEAPAEETVAETEAPVEETEAPAEETVAETEAPVEETEAPAEEVVETEAPAEETVETEAPQTFDAGVIAAVVAAVSAAGYAVSKKSR